MDLTNARNQINTETPSFCGSSSEDPEYRAIQDHTENYDTKGLVSSSSFDRSNDIPRESVTEASAGPSCRSNSAQSSINEIPCTNHSSSQATLEQEDSSAGVSINPDLEKLWYEFTQSGPLPNDIDRHTSDNETSSNFSDDSTSQSRSRSSTEFTTPSNSPVIPNASTPPTPETFTINIANGIPKEPLNLTLYASQQYSKLSILQDYKFRKTKPQNPPLKRRPKIILSCIEKPRDPEHKCPKCEVEYHDARYFMAHFYFCTGFPLFTCTTCKKRFLRDDFWQGHYKSPKHKKKLSQALMGIGVDKSKRKKTKAASRIGKAARRS